MRKRKMAAVLLAAALAATPVCGQFAMRAEAETVSQEAVGINVIYHTQQEILDRIKSDGISMTDALTFGENPVTTAPYSAGSLSQATLDSALATINQIRYIAGLPDNVVLSQEQNAYAQAAALVNYVNNQLSHTPTKPADMDEALYAQGYDGAQSSNIAMASWQNRSLNETIMHGWMDDGDKSNVDRVGHRRWVLNPTMGATGFGAVSGANGTYSAMYSFDRSGSGTQYGVAWPAQNMPVDYFEASYPWSISMGSSVNADAVKVTLTRVSDNRTWSFSTASADGTFHVNNGGYGQTGCIIFRPDDVGSYSAGDSFKVTIEGLDSPVSYTVNFFNEESVNGSQDDNTQQPGGGNDGDDTQQPGGGEDGDDTQKPGGGNDGDGTQKPGGGEDGDDTQQPGGDGNGTVSGGDGSVSDNNPQPPGNDQDDDQDNNQDNNPQPPDNDQDNDQDNNPQPPDNDQNNNQDNTQNDSQSNSQSDNQDKSPAVNEIVVAEDGMYENVVVKWGAVNADIAASAQSSGRNIDVIVGRRAAVPADILNQIAGRDMTLALHLGRGLALTITGTDMGSENTEFRVNLVSSTIPAQTAAAILENTARSREFSFDTEGVFPFRINMHINLGVENAGRTAVLYRFDSVKGIMVRTGVFVVNENGQAMFGLEQGGQYVAVVEEIRESREYKVVPGDTFNRIAARHGMTTAALKAANPSVRNINKIRVGQVLKID